MKNMVWSKTFRIILYVFTTIGIGLAVYFLIKRDWYRMFLGLSSLLMLFIPAILKRCGVLPAYKLYISLYVVLILSYHIGIVLNGYEVIPLYDKFIHLIAGIFGTIVGGCLFFFISKITDKRKWIASMLFSLAFSMLLSLFWEFLEFFKYIFTGFDAQHTLTTGVFDTMVDLLYCFGSSLLTIALVFLYAAKGIRSFVISIMEEFCGTNHC